jgi:hypothetical protein
MFFTLFHLPNMFTKPIQYRFTGWTLLFLVAIPLWFGSCKKDEDENGPGTVEGNWKVTSGTINPGVLGFTDFVAVGGYLNNSTCLTDLTVSFKGDGKLQLDNPSSCDKINPKVISDVTGIETNSTWVHTGDKLTLTAPGGMKREYGVSVNNKTMQLSFSNNADWDNDGVISKYDYVLVFNRQ